MWMRHGSFALLGVIAVRTCCGLRHDHEPDTGYYQVLKSGHILHGKHWNAHNATKPDNRSASGHEQRPALLQELSQHDHQKASLAPPEASSDESAEPIAEAVHPSEGLPEAPAVHRSEDEPKAPAVHPSEDQPQAPAMHPSDEANQEMHAAPDETADSAPPPDAAAEAPREETPARSVEPLPDETPEAGDAQAPKGDADSDDDGDSADDDDSPNSQAGEKLAPKGDDDDSADDEDDEDDDDSADPQAAENGNDNVALADGRIAADEGAGPGRVQQKIMRQLERDLEAQDLEAWKRDLQAVEDLMANEEGPLQLDINSPPGASSTLAGEHLGRGAGGADTLTVLGRAAGAGWLPGLEALVEWDRGRLDRGPRLRLGDGGTDASGSGAPLSPLTLAAENSHGSVVRHLLKLRASPMVPGKDGRTPLELAAAAGDAYVVDSLLVKGSPLAHGLAPLHQDLAKRAEKLPQLDQRWPFGSSGDEVMESMQQKATSFGIAPSDAYELAMVGHQPADWITLYKIRVMHALSTAPTLGSEDASQAEALLSTHMYDSFARGFSTSVVILFGMLGLFGVFVYVIFRIRLYGGAEVPVCLAHMVPGSFDPLRLTDADFDPSRQIQSFPYNASKEILQQKTSPMNSAVFVKAFLGVFSSWLFLTVRIPPVKDSFDEDFLSDDDEVSRTRVCEQCSRKARFSHKLEVFIRSIVLCVLLWWLCWQSQRWSEAAIIIFVYVQFSLVASSVADAAVPALKEQASDDPNEDITDAARLVYSLFGVQHGPRWTRSVCSTRSTAAPSKSRLARRQRPKRAARTRKEEISQEGAEDALDAIDHQDSDKNIGAEASEAASEEKEEKGESFFECWQRSFMQSGLLHIEHRAFLETSVTNMLMIGFTLLWLTHLRLLARASFHSFYSAASPAYLLQVYGAPGSGGRGLALTLQVALLFFVAERLHSITGLLQVAALSLQQRYRALLFAGDHPPPPVLKTGETDQAVVFKEASNRIDERVRCGEYAVDLSNARWAVLRAPVFLVYAIDLMLLAISIVTTLFTCFEAVSDAVFPHLQKILHEHVLEWLRTWTVDPMVPLGIALCLTWPLLLVLVAAAQSNGEVFELRRQLREETASSLAMIAAGEQADDVKYVALRLKADEALKGNMIAWRCERDLSLFEPALLLATTAVACGLAVATGSALPGIVGSLQQSLL